MNITNPILVKSVDILLPDDKNEKTIKAELKIQSFENPIWQSGEIVKTMATITRYDNKTTWGIAFYAEPMEDEEMKEKLEELSSNPTTIKAPYS